MRAELIEFFEGWLFIKYGEEIRKSFDQLINLLLNLIRSGGSPLPSIEAVRNFVGGWSVWRRRLARAALFVVSPLYGIDLGRRRFRQFQQLVNCIKVP